MSDDAFQAILDDSFPAVSICGIVFDAGYALRKLDPIAFQFAKSQMEDAMEETK
jgi:hypothetical protein